MLDSLQDLMREARQLTRSGRLTAATSAIQRALRGAAAGPDGSPPATGSADAAATRRARGRPTPVAPGAVRAAEQVIDGCVAEVAAEAPAPHRAAAADAAPPAPDTFQGGIHTRAPLTRAYKLYSPPQAAQGERLPLVVMLHGCTQDPDDFAAGTAMNERAREQGFYVLYPAQSQEANAHRCWNWFKHNHQRRGSGEPAFIAGLTREVLARHGVDPQRVYIAGLSAGGAMAAIVAAAYPDLYAAVGVHSGLPRGAASDVAGALSVMNSGVAAPSRPLGGRAASLPPAPHVPTIVFHGDQDRTVHARNGEQLIAAALQAAGAAPSALAEGAATAQVEQGATARGRQYTRRSHVAADGRPLAEHWLLHGAGHAWSGGSSRGSYTDASGPDATAEMLRFFFAHRLPGTGR